MMLNTISSMKRDFLASHLRSQIFTLQSVLKVIENDEEVNEMGTNEDLRKVEGVLRNLRKLNANN